MSKILITGGAGFIGAHTAKALLDAGEEVVLYDNLDDFLYPTEFKQKRLEHVFAGQDRPKLVIGDILDGKLLNEVFADEEFDKVIHLAALANPGKSMDAAEPYTLVNVMGSLNVLELAREYEVPHVIVAGSSSVYNDEQTPFIETMYPLRPRSPYGASKAAMETYCRLWHELHGIHITVLRFFSVYGPWGRPDMAPMIFADRILDDQQLELSQNRERDFTYIDDIVRGILAAVEKRFEYEVINLGRGEPQKLEQFVQAIEAAAGRKANIVMREAPPGEMQATYANIEKAKDLLGYHPTVSIEEGAAKLVDWVKTYRTL